MLFFTFATCQEKLAALPKKRDRKIGRKAFKYLTEDAQDSSAYIDFVIRHLEFLKRHRAPTAQQRKLPLRFLEEQGLECCLWPHLYWRKELCETVVRATDERRKRGQANDSSSSEQASSLSGSEGQGPKLKRGRRSIKKSFLTKVLSPVIGYPETYDLLHFVRDLSMWSTLGATKNSARGIPLRLALQGASFSPEYWRVRTSRNKWVCRTCFVPELLMNAPFHTINGCWMRWRRLVEVGKNFLGRKPSTWHTFSRSWTEATSLGSTSRLNVQIAVGGTICSARRMVLRRRR